ncbi:site-specific integrase, partial [Leeuwenhoekiella sp. UBA4164]|uniref:site-specific integrase n=1 Tax=Leeuwenhoekiella sp. UBA4164 TaxID=1946746 RepID=UPI0025B8BC80
MPVKSTLGVTFFTRPKRNNLNKLDIYLRITVNKKRSEMSLKHDVDVKDWDAMRLRANETSENLIALNAYMDDVKAEVLNAHKELHAERKVITAKAIKLRYMGEDEERMTLLELVRYHNDNMNLSLKPGTMKNYYSTERYIKSFLLEHYKTDNFYLVDLNYRFITEFERYIRTYKPKKKRKTCSNNGTMKHLERLRKMVNLAVRMEWLPKDPFVNYKLKFERTERCFLTQRELDIIEATHFKSKGYERVRDCFLFACYTGLSYGDLKELRKNQLVLNANDRIWIYTKREKTNQSVKIPLLPKALALIEKYTNENELEISGKVMPVYSNQKINKYL